MGEIWQISRRTEKETKQIARSVCIMVKSQERNNFDTAFASPSINTSTIVPDVQAFEVGWQELGQLELFNGWDGVTGVGGISI